MPQSSSCRSLLLASALLVAHGCSQPADVAEQPAPANQPAPGDQPSADRAATNPPAATDVEYTALQTRPDRLVASLPNGLIVIAQRVPTEPVVSVQAWVKTGSIYEQEHVGAGLSHFLEHLLSGGTTSTRKEDDTNKLLGEIGAQINAATSLDNVHYYINTTSDHAGTAIELMSDWMRNNLVLQEEFDRERDVIQKEFSMGEGDPGRIFWKLTQQARYTAHPARHPTIGYLDEFLQITRDGIYDFYKRMYVPNNTVFVVVGDVDPRKVVDQVAGLWKDAEPGKLPELSFPVEPEIASPRTLSGTADVQRPRLRLAWPGTRLGAEGDYALDLLSSVLGQGESSRLVRSVRDEKGLVSDIEAYNYSLHWGEGFFGIDAEIASPDASLDTIKAEVLAQVEPLRTGLVSDAELARAKRKVMAAVALRNQTVEGMASRLASDVIATGDPDYLQKYSEKIQAVTPEELRAAAQKFLTPERLITVSLLPRPKDQAPVRLTRPAEPTEQFEEVPVVIDNSALLAKLKAEVAEGEAKAIEVSPPEMTTLDNGLRVIVQRNTTVPGVAMQLYWLGGLLAEEPGREGIASAMANMMLRGTESKNAQQIAAAVEDLGASMNTESGNNTTFITATALKQDWPTVMGLMAEVVLQPSFPEDEWKRLQPRLLAAIARQSDTWSGELRQRFRDAYYGEHPWSQTPLGRKDVVEALTTDDLRAFHTARLGAGDAVLVVVGDVDPAAAVAAAKEHFGDMTTDPQGAFNAPIPAPPTAMVKQVETRKPVAAVNIGFGPGIERSHPDYAEVQVLSTLMSDFPTGWLEQELRGRGPGLVYAVGAGMQSGLVPGHFAILFNTQPQSVVEATTRAMSVVERAKTGEISDQDLARAKAKVLSEEFFGRQGNSSRAAGLALDELYGVNDPEAEKFIGEVKATTASDVKRVAEKYLVNPVVVVLTNELVDEAALNAAVTGAPVAATTPTPVEEPAMVK